MTNTRLKNILLYIFPALAMWNVSVSPIISLTSHNWSILVIFSANPILFQVYVSSRNISINQHQIMI